MKHPLFSQTRGQVRATRAESLSRRWVQRRCWPSLLGFGIAVSGVLNPPAAGAEGSAGDAAFARLKGLAGEWQGTIGKADGPATSVSYRLTANGNTVMETLFPGTRHEMISMYHLDRGELVLTHYCAMGNQPHMRLDPVASQPTVLVFKFDGGTNLDPQKDGHIHSGTIRLLDPNRLEADWIVFKNNQPVGTNVFLLTRKTP